MRSALLRYTLIFIFLCVNSYVFAQGDAVKRKLDSLQTKNNLNEWLYERLDYVSLNPQQRLLFLLETQKKLWRQPKTQDEYYAYLDLLNTQGYYQLLAGNILSAIDSYEAAFVYYKKNKVASYDIVEYTLKPLSNNYTRLGDYERALFLQQKAVNFLIQTKDKPENIAAVYSNMAISYRSMGNFSDAEKSIKAGLALVKPGTQVDIILNNILADIFFDQKEYIKAAKLIETNINKQKNIKSENAYWLMSTYTTAGNIYLALSKTQKADEYFNKALNVLNTYNANSRFREKANILTQLGRIKLLQNQPLVALQFFNKTLTTLKIVDKNNSLIISKIYGDNKLVEVFEQMANAYLLLKKPTEAFQHIKLGLLSADKIRSEFADDETKERLQADLKIIAERGIEISFNLYQQTKDKSLLTGILDLAEQNKARTLLDQINRNQLLNAANKKDSLFIKKQALERAVIYNEKQALEAKENENAKTIASLKYDLALINKQIKQKYKQFNFDNEVKVSSLLSALPNKKILEYFVGRNAIYLIDIKDRKIDDVIKIENASNIESLIKTYSNTYFQHGPNAMLNAPKEFFLASNKIYQSILKDIKLTKNEPVIIVPDEVLGYISFDGLITTNQYTPNISSWPFLIKNNTITYAFSLKTLTANKTEVNHKDFAGLFITHQKNSNKPLKAVQDEADGIKKLIRGKFLFNDEVNSKTFINAFEESKILHIGTHAYLSGKSQEPTLDFGKEKIFLFELAAKKSAPSLAVLSACRTADGLLANGEGIISLSRGFNAIGTPATIAGLWNVNDVTASVITGNFYKHLLAHKSNGEALHSAKLDWLNANQTTDALYLPYYWDSLIYMGTDQQIAMQPAISWRLWMGIGVGICLCLALVVFWRKKRFPRRYAPRNDD
ncbi:CHAT domain-containing protein [Pedobacter sp. LMG 31464]|uniref:CHAT domain-containing protein n=1 Tax=Pedobacter planticolens TaxID=2679964 RepID=A0A923DWW3_9SPHI|nr:CHAT domain-containing protein [Pedobacter planticolens]MBB2144155.1 CHAT domain-containing protein [Pedobacter planticolens]